MKRLGTRRLEVGLYCLGETVYESDLRKEGFLDRYLDGCSPDAGGTP